MKRFSVVLISSLLLFSTVCRADTINDLLAKYGIHTQEAKNIQSYNQLVTRYNQYRQLQADRKKKNSLESFEAAADELMLERMQSFDINALFQTMESKLHYLTALVNADADIEEIFAAEKEYREAKDIYETCYMIYTAYNERIGIDKLSEALPDISQEEIDSIYQALANDKSNLGTIIEYPNIGTLTGLQFPVKGSTISSRFGSREIGNRTEKHFGLDFSHPEDATVQAILGGKVIACNQSDELGNYIIIAASKDVYILYGHLKTQNVYVNQIINQYDPIGTSTDKTHLGVYINDVKVDPSILYN